MFANRMDRVRRAMTEAGVDALLLSVGPDLPWLVGYQAMASERLTMLVVRADGGDDGRAELVIPAFEVPRVVERPDVFGVRGWGETEDPVAIVAGLVGDAGRVAVGDHTWSRFTIALQRALPGASLVEAGTVTGALRAIKEPDEVARLQAAAAVATR